MKNNKIIIISVILAIVTALGITVAAAYDSSEDPLISLSYLLDVFEPELFDKFETRFNELEEFLVDTINDRLDDASGSGGESSNNSSSAIFQVVELTTGDQLYAVSACEIQLRAGKASCIAPDASQGLSDYTVGAEIYDGQPLTINHMCLIPRGDGRGIVAESESVFVMVRGEYTIVKQ
jgi:hypothetical protein